jgi:uncharacterized membrane protein
MADDTKDSQIQEQQKKIAELKQLLTMKQLRQELLSDKVNALDDHSMQEYDDLVDNSVEAIQRQEITAMLTTVQRMQHEIEEKKRHVETLEQLQRKNNLGIAASKRAQSNTFKRRDVKDEEMIQSFLYD